MPADQIQIYPGTVRIYQSATDDFVLFDGATKRRYPTFAEAMNAMATVEAGEQPIEIELATRITGRILPILREVLTELSAVQMAWIDNDVQALIDDAKSKNTTLVGFTPATWELWGTAFTLFQLFAVAPQEAIGGVALRKVVMQKYVSAVDTPETAPVEPEPAP
jgi:hypothetical protein